MTADEDVVECVVSMTTYEHHGYGVIVSGTLRSVNHVVKSLRGSGNQIIMLLMRKIGEQNWINCCDK